MLSASWRPKSHPQPPTTKGNTKEDHEVGVRPLVEEIDRKQTTWGWVNSRYRNVRNFFLSSRVECTYLEGVPRLKGMFVFVVVQQEKLSCPEPKVFRPPNKITYITVLLLERTHLKCPWACTQSDSRNGKNNTEKRSNQQIHRQLRSRWGTHSSLSTSATEVIGEDMMVVCVNGVFDRCGSKCRNKCKFFCEQIVEQMGVKIERLCSWREKEDKITQKVWGRNPNTYIEHLDTVSSTY